MKSYQEWFKRFRANDLEDFTMSSEGRLWLKVRSIDRKKILTAFASEFMPSVDLKSDNARERLWQGVVASEEVQRGLDTFLARCQREMNDRIDGMLETIRSNLYQMETFQWGGDFRNSLDKAIVSRFVKTRDIVPYNRLDDICDGELHEMARGYLRNSWYNYWSSVLIENVFRHLPNVLSAPGEIKNVDFFVDGIPFDLKVTYFPREYAKARLKAMGLDDPAKRLKDFAKKTGIPFAKGDPESQRREIERRIADSARSEGLALLRTIRKDWNRLVKEARKEPRELMKWLYEEQGDMRFGAENRLFLILVDRDDERESWKLKRNVDLIQAGVSKWIRAFRRSSLENLRLEFNYGGREYRTFADAIFICKGGAKCKGGAHGC